MTNKALILLSLLLLSCKTTSGDDGSDLASLEKIPLSESTIYVTEMFADQITSNLQPYQPETLEESAPETEIFPFAYLKKTEQRLKLGFDPEDINSYVTTE